MDFATNAGKAVDEITGVTGALKSAAVAAGALFAVDQVKDFLISSKAAYQESAMAEAALLTALKGRQSTQMALIAQAEELQGKTLFDDDETVRAQSLVAAFVKEEAAIKRLIPLIQDFATAKQMDLASAADLVTKTFAGQMNALGRYGIEIEGAAGSAERLDMIAQQLTEHFGGQAVAAAQASDGTSMLANNFENLKEQIGGAIANSERYKALISEMSKTVTILTSDLSFWQKINPFESQEKTYQKALASIKERQQAEIEAAKAAEAAAEAGGKNTKGIADEIVVTAKSISSYADLKAAIAEKTLALESANMSDRGYILTLKSEIEYLQKKKQAFDDLGKPTVKREKVESLTEMKTNISSDAMRITTPFAGLDTTTLGDLAPWQQQQADRLAEASKTWWDYEENVSAVVDSIGYGMESLGLSIVESLGLADDGFEGFLGKMLETATTLISMMLAQSIANAIGGATAAGAATGPASIFTTPAFIATAIGGVMAAFAAIPKFAAGGIAYGPTMGMFGEYPGAASNPEIIAPLSKLKAMIEPAGSAPVILQPSIEYSPEGFRIMLNRANERIYKRT